MGGLWHFAYFCSTAVTYSWGFSRLVSFFSPEYFVCSWKFIFIFFFSFSVPFQLGEKIFQLIKLFWEVLHRYFWICWRFVLFFIFVIHSQNFISIYEMSGKMREKFMNDQIILLEELNVLFLFFKKKKHFLSESHLEVLLTSLPHF